MNVNIEISKMKIKLLIIFLLLSYFSHAQGLISGKADSILERNNALKSFTRDVFVSGQDSMYYRLLYPANYKKDKKYPIVIFLAGDGERGNDNEKQLYAIPEALVDKSGRQKHPCFILAPQCPKKRLWVHFPDFPKSLQATIDPTYPAKWTFELLDQLTKKLPIDNKRIYITGYSGGGEGTFDFLTRRPDLFAAAIPICSVSDTSKASLISHIPIWAFHGDKDPINDVKYSRFMIAALQKNGGKPKYTEYPELGHNIVLKVYHEPNLFGWLFSQRKDD